ncbi:MAG: DUF1501 domain-containing protein [Gemmataceae bacterium]
MLDRRTFLSRFSAGFGSVGLAQLLAADAGARPESSAAKSVILLFMQGGPSHLETFDPKPALRRYDGQPLPPSFDATRLPLQFMKATDGKLMASPFRFRRFGRSGLQISEVFSRLGACADDLAVVRSCHHDSFIHGPALSLMHTGSTLLGHPSVGAWVVYGLGRLSDSLPAYVAMANGPIRNGPSLYGAGFLPAVHQGTLLRGEGVPIQNLQPATADQRKLLDRLREWNQEHAAARPGDSRLEARIASYELAFRMQAAAPELIDLSREPLAVRESYGAERGPTARFGQMCLLARRMVERGVRFVHLLHGDWDGHGRCADNVRDNAAAIDQPIAALLTDLKQRGLLDSTLVVWTGEFGRTPVMQGGAGRDHSPYGFSSWLAGGGVRGGQVVGATDEFGFRAVENKVHVHDLHATLLSLLGLDHRALTFRFEGRDRRLTDVGGDNDLAGRLRRP